MKKRLLTFALCLAVLGACFGAFAGCGNRSATITVSGSSSVTPLMEALAAEYEKTHDVRIAVNMSSSGEGISDTQNGLNDFGMSSRELKSSDAGVRGKKLCMDGIALIVNNNSSLENVSAADVKALFENGTRIPGTEITAAIGRKDGSGTRSAFDELLEIESYYAGVATQDETGNVIEVIQESTNSIGYISFGSLTSSVKAVSLDGVACTYENIINNSYALQRPFIIVLKEGKKLSEAAQAFYDYIMSDEAQSVITGNGYISIK